MSEEKRLVPVQLGTQRVFVSVDILGTVGESADERDVSSRPLNMDEVIAGLTAFAQQAAAELATTEAHKVSVEFGCDIGVESGTLVAVLGKASTRSSIKVGLEWQRSTEITVTSPVDAPGETS